MAFSYLVELSQRVGVPGDVRSVHLKKGGVALDDGDDATVAAHLRRPGAEHTGQDKTRQDKTRHGAEHTTHNTKSTPHRTTKARFSC